MRGIRIKLSVFEFDVLKGIIQEALPGLNAMQQIAARNILKQFQTKMDKAEGKA